MVRDDRAMAHTDEKMHRIRLQVAYILRSPILSSAYLVQQKKL